MKLQTLGHDTDKLRGRSWDEITGPHTPRMEFVITLCDTPHGQECPDFGGVAVTAGMKAMAMIRKGQIRNILGNDIRAQSTFIAGLFEIVA